MLLPELPIVAHHRGEEDERGADEPSARVVHRGRGHAARIVAVDVRAAAVGIRVGHSLASARVRCAGLRSLAEDGARLAVARREILSTLLELSPRIGWDGALRLWIEPVLGPSGDEARWCEAVARRLRGWGAVDVAVGPFAAAAYARARFGADLGRCSLEALELDARTRRTLAGLGVRTVAALRGLDPVELGSRLGRDAARAWRRASGDDPRGPWKPRRSTEARVVVRLETPLERLDALRFLLRPAVERLLRETVGQGRGITESRLTLQRAGGLKQRVSARTAGPVGDASTLFMLLSTELEQASMPKGDEASEPPAVVGFELSAQATGALGERTVPLFDRRLDPIAAEVAIARLCARFGPRTVRRAERVEHADPRSRARWVAAGGVPRAGTALPWRAFEPPELVRDDTLRVAGRRLHVQRKGRIERALLPWWRTGALRVERFRWAELEGPLLVLLRERRERPRGQWEAVAWVD